MPFFNKSANDLFQKGIRLAERAKYEEALPFFEEALRIEPNNAKYAFNVGICRNGGNITLGADHAFYFEEAFRLDPENASYAYYAGLCYLSESFYSSPNFQGNHYDDAKAARYKSLIEKALIFFEAAYPIVVKDFEDKVLLTSCIASLAECFTSLDDHRSALYYFKEALRFDPDNERVQKALDDCLALQNASSLKNPLDDLIGLSLVKDEMLRIQSRVKFDQEQGIITTYRHFMFTGNPGTGKTTVARLLGQLLYEVGFLKTTKFVEASRATLVAKYLGQTSSQTREVIETALDGVLFIDEAHMLVPSDRSSEDYGKEALSEINKAMEDYRSRLVVIFAGYAEPMQRLYTVEPGLKSRITRTIFFPDYSANELATIFYREVKSRSLLVDGDEGGMLDILLEKELTRIVADQGGQVFGNARGVRNIVERLIDEHALDAMNRKLDRQQSKIIPVETVASTLAQF